MDYVSRFEHNVQTRIKEVSKGSKLPAADMRPTSVFVGIALGALFAQINMAKLVK